MKYYYKKNGGLSSVKNFGLSKACGKYIIFMDADDEIKPNGYLTMLKNAIDKDADIVVCDMELINESNGPINYPVYHKDYKGAKAYLVDGLMASSNNKMIKKSLYDKVGNYPEGKNNEDVAVTHVLLTIAKKIEYIHSSFYRYYQREGSIQHTKFNINRLVIFDTVKQAIDSVKKLAPSEADTISGIIICNQLIALLIYIIYPMNDNKLKYQIIKEFSNRYKNLDTQNNKYIKDYCAEIGLSNLQDHILHSSPRIICLYIKWSHFTDYLKRAFGIKKLPN
jgi:glycosyltransferase involved in cell wall biosynthesis